MPQITANNPNIFDSSSAARNLEKSSSSPKLSSSWKSGELDVKKTALARPN